jgi:hypothetical protein
VVELFAQRTQACFYVAKAAPVSLVGEGHRQILITTRNPAAGHHRRSAPHTGETRDPAESPAIERTRFGPRSRTMVARLGAGFQSRLPFKSRQGKNARSPQQKKGLSTGRRSLSGHWW